MYNKVTKNIVCCLLGLMFILLFTSAWGDSATMDELAHIPSGYSYLTEQDYRLNPEHPPLIKDLSAIPLMFLDLNFPTDSYAWTNMLNGQWDMGRIFLYESGNDADQILRFSRFPIILLTILFGWMFFKWTSSLYGNKVGLLALFFFVFSPTFLAHSKYVTTDLGAAFGFFIGIASFVNFLQKGSYKSLFLAGFALGIAQLLKFSLAMLAPLYIIWGLLWVFLSNYENLAGLHRSAVGKYIKESFVMLFKVALIGAVCIAVIFPVYLFHIWNYPIERQLADTVEILEGFRFQPLADFVIWLSNMPILRAVGHYLLGILMVLWRAAGGNTAYFLGELNNVGWWYYFPVLYLFKEHLAFHILTVAALLFGVKNIRKNREPGFGKQIKASFNWMRENIAITIGITFIAIYWLQAVTSPLNIGVRHVMPTFPFIYLFVSRQIIRWINKYSPETPVGFLDYVKEFYKLYIKPIKKGFLVCLLLIWMFLSAIISFPHYIPYYNALGGGTENGYKMAVDSNYDWGQDLKRLKTWTDENLAVDEKIAIDYFGGGDLKYYFKDKYEPWWSAKGTLEKREDAPKWFAVSISFLQSTYGETTKGFTVKPEDKYDWMKGREPVARAGKSIFIYKFD